MVETLLNCNLSINEIDVVKGVKSIHKDICAEYQHDSTLAFCLIDIWRNYVGYNFTGKAEERGIAVAMVSDNNAAEGIIDK